MHWSSVAQRLFLDSLWLKGNEGDLDYKLPTNTDLTRYSTVAIYCERFHAVFGTATLQPF